MAIVGLSGPAPEPALGESPGALATVARVAFAAAFAALRSRFGARCRFRPFEDPAHTRLNRLIDVEDEMTCTGFGFFVPAKCRRAVNAKHIGV